MALATFANWGSNLVVALAFPPVVQAMGPPTTFFLFGLASIASLVFVYRRVPETKQRTLEGDRGRLA